MENIVETWDDLLAVEDTDYDFVDLPSGKTVRLGSLSAGAMMEWFKVNESDEGQKTGGLLLVARSIVNSKGARIGRIEDLIALRAKAPKTLKLLVRRASVLNGLQIAGDKPDVEQPPTAAVEIKNGSGETPSDVSPSDSPSA